MLSQRRKSVFFLFVYAKYSFISYLFIYHKICVILSHHRRRRVCLSLEGVTDTWACLSDFPFTFLPSFFVFFLYFLRSLTGIGRLRTFIQCLPAKLIDTARYKLRQPSISFKFTSATNGILNSRKANELSISSNVFL